MAREKLETVTSCPICLSTNLNPFRQLGEWSLIKCQDCTFVMLSPQPTPTYLNDLYSDKSYFTERVQRLPDSQTAEIRVGKAMPLIQKLTEKTGKVGRVLEIGCGYGFLLAAAKQAGWQTVGIELSSHAAAFARQTFDLDIHEAPAEILPELEIGEFDAVLMFSVLEHLPQPNLVLQAVHQMMTSSSLLWAVIPNVNSMDRYWHGDEWSGWDPPYHLWHFSSSTVSRLLTKCGFETVTTENVFFNPVTHIRVGRKVGNWRADVREWQLANQSPTSQIPQRSLSQSASKKKMPQILKSFKTIFSERDMNVWARRA